MTNREALGEESCALVSSNPGRTWGRGAVSSIVPPSFTAVSSASLDRPAHNSKDGAVGTHTVFSRISAHALEIDGQNTVVGAYIVHRQAICMYNAYIHEP